MDDSGSVSVAVQPFRPVYPGTTVQNLQYFLLLEIIVEYLALFDLVVFLLRVVQRAMMLGLQEVVGQPRFKHVAIIVAALNVPILLRSLNPEHLSSHLFIDFLRGLSPPFEGTLFKMATFGLILAIQYLIFKLHS